MTSPASETLDAEGFQRLVEPFRGELQVHCYRMLGSLADAEDTVQETLLRAWRGFERFQGRTSLRRWLYRIATNACLDLLARRSTRRRVLPEQTGPAAGAARPGEPSSEILWLEPYPDTALASIPDPAPGPEARYEQHDAIQLAFVAAIQYLPPRQRAVLLLRDVLGWSAAETAQLLQTTASSVNSALQRARATLSNRLPMGPPSGAVAVGATQRVLLDRYVRAWESDDLDGFVALLRDDAVLAMPPWRAWYRGPGAIAGFIRWARSAGGAGPDRLVATGANGQPAFALYSWDDAAALHRLHGLQVLDLAGDTVRRITIFRDRRLLSRFGLPDAFGP